MRSNGCVQHMQTPTRAVDGQERAGVITAGATRLVRAIRARLAAFHQHWFVACDEPSDPFASLSARDRWDLPVFHPAQPED